MYTLKVAGLETPIDLASIIWIKGDGNYAYIYFPEGTFYLATLTLSWFENQLPSFIRIHKSALINPAHAVGFEQPSAKRARVIMSNGQALSLSRRRIDGVRARLGMIPL